MYFREPSIQFTVDEKPLGNRYLILSCRINEADACSIGNRYLYISVCIQKNIVAAGKADWRLSIQASGTAAGVAGGLGGNPYHLAPPAQPWLNPSA